MALRQLRYNEDPILRKKCKDVLVVDDRIRDILSDMAETMYNTSNGAGLAANQIGLLKRLVVIDMGEGLIKLVNPRIISASGTQDCVEGCLSFPNRFGKTVRPAEVTISALNEHGEPITLTGKGDLAKCFCHELDHLDGIIFIDHVTEWLTPEV